MWCLEKFLRFLNKNAYILVSFLHNIEIDNYSIFVLGIHNYALNHLVTCFCLKRCTCIKIMIFYNKIKDHYSLKSFYVQYLPQ